MAHLTLSEWLARAENNPRFMENVTAVRHLPAKDAVLAPYPAWVDGRIRAVLNRRGIKSLYSHQARAVELIRSGRDVVLVTPTASGKTLCYNLPVLQKILENGENRALYLFPTKALAQDQMHEIHSLITELKADIRTFTYDGDARRRAAGNPEAGPWSSPTRTCSMPGSASPHQVAEALLNLAYIVIDELHVYRGSSAAI